MTAPKQVYLFLALGLLVASQSGNIIRLGDAHPVAIATWRLVIASLLLAPLAGRDLSLLAKLTWREALLLVGAGTALAVHFYAWTSAVQHTTVANAATFFAINPVITATSAYLVFREPVSRRLAGAIALGLAGVAMLGWSDLSFAPENLLGDGLALFCSLLFTLYFLLGKRLRRVLPTTAYVAAVYGVAALVGAATMLFMDLPATGYNDRTWLCFVLMALGPTMIGHTSFNHALAHLRAGWISAATLSEPLFAGLVAWFAWDEEVTGMGVAGYVVICASVVVLVWDRKDNEDGKS
jgi:drug/metabolite transporter (DMT)-like permease